jgi:AmmeMemoRadiSam system protein B
LDFVVILGTDHSPGLLPYVATGKRYATPLGIAPAATDIFAALKRRLPWIVREEIRHRDALSVELAVLYLQYLYGTACPPILPILCGQTSLSERAEQETDRFLATLEGLVEDSNMLWWTSAELSHAGQAYGRPSLEPGTRAVLRARDEACLEALRAGRPDRLARHCSTPHPQGRLSGGAAVTTLSRLLPVGYRTEVARYMMVEAPGGTPGALGLAGVRLARPI